MTSPHVCDAQGWLSAPGAPLLADLTDWCWPGRQPSPAGCNHLVCFICSAVVKQRPGWLANTEALGTGSEWRQKCTGLYEAESWEGFAYVRQVPAWRLYVCRCSVVNNDTTRPIVDPHADDQFGQPPVAPYRCAGHPLPDLPFRFHGLEVDASTDAHAQVRDALTGKIPPSAIAEDLTPTNLVVNLRRRVEDTPAADRVDAAVIRCLDDADARVVSGAIAYVWNVRTEPLAQALLAAATKHREAWLATADPTPADGPTLWARALTTFDPLVPQLIPTAGVLPWLREAATRPAHGAAVLTALMRVDAAWAKGRLRDILAAQVGSEETTFRLLFSSSVPAQDIVRSMLAAGSPAAEVRRVVNLFLWGDFLKKSLQVLDAADRTRS